LLQAMEQVHAGIMISRPDGRVAQQCAAAGRALRDVRRNTWESLVRAMPAAPTPTPSV
jgi:hypothetical protein